VKRSRINAAIREATAAFERHGWTLPPNPRWDVTDFGLGDFENCGLVLVNLAEQPEYCEKLMFTKKNQKTPEHYHASKKEDIICRYGELAVQLLPKGQPLSVQVNGELQAVPTDKPLVLPSGWRVTLTQQVAHAFWAQTDYAVVGEVSTANDDAQDNFFANPEIGRFSAIEEDEPPLVRLVSDA